MSIAIDNLTRRQDTEEGAPLYRRIENALREKIVRGEWPAGKALPNRRQLCKEFSTTRVTLDKAIHGLIREGLINSAKGSGTFVSNSSPRSTTRQANGSNHSNGTHALRVGVLLGRETPDNTSDLTEVDNFYLGPLLAGIRDGVVDKPVDLTYTKVPAGDYLDFYRQSAIDGLIIIAPTVGEIAAMRRLYDAQVPFVMVGLSSDQPEDAMLPSVDTDNRNGAALAVQHLLELGHTEIALVNLTLSHGDHLDRMDGFLHALAAASIPVRPENLVLNSSYDLTQFESRIDAWLTAAKSERRMPTAVFACDYLMTLATLRVLRRHGLSIPDDISVVGFDDSLSAEHLTPPLTTVRQPVYQMGLCAIHRLLQALQSDYDISLLRGLEILRTELVVRESTNSRPPTGTPGGYLTKGMRNLS